MNSYSLFGFLSGMGPRTFRSKAVELGDRSIWTDTPADKERKRLVRKLFLLIFLSLII